MRLPKTKSRKLLEQVQAHRGNEAYNLRAMRSSLQTGNAEASEFFFNEARESRQTARSLAKEARDNLSLFYAARQKKIRQRRLQRRKIARKL